jgi:hypothetical protein
MKSTRWCRLLFGAVFLFGVFPGCGGGGGPEALPSKPAVDSDEQVKVEGIEAKPKKKGLTESKGPQAIPGQ